MFERNRIDTAVQQTTVPAELTRDDGEILKGRFLITAGRNIYEVLNGDSYFLEFETYDGDRSLIARTAIKSVRILPVANAHQLKNRVRDGDTFDPYSVLGVTQSTSWEDVRAAYLNLSKIYHPDRFSNVALPAEVRDYLSAMSRRINTAYAALEVPVQAARRVAMAKSAAVFTTPVRAAEPR